MCNRHNLTQSVIIITKDFVNIPLVSSTIQNYLALDSIEVLISNGCGAPANLMLRSAFEGKLTISYLLERQTKVRANAWLVNNIIDQIETLENNYPEEYS